MGRLSVLLLCCAVTTSGCIYANVNTPLSYRSPTASDVGGSSHLAEEVWGEACNQAVLGLVAWGDGGYGAAMADARSRGNVTMLADVRADERLFNVLGVYQRVCTRVSARAVR